MPDKIKFRKEAVDQLSSPDQLDQLISVVTPRSWIVLSTLYTLLFCVFIWSIIGSIPTRLEGQGILLAGGGNIFNAVIPEGPSYVKNIWVKSGDPVKKGQVIAILSRPDLLDDIKVTQNYLNTLQLKQTQLIELSKSQIAAHQQEAQAQKASLQQSIATTKKRSDSLSVLLKIRQKALKTGIETRENVERTFQEHQSILNEMEAYKNKLIELDIAQTAFNDKWQERLRQLSLKITDETVKLKNLQTRIELSTQVRSPVNGIVTDIHATLGSIVNIGAPLISIASGGSGMDALIYLAPKDGKRVKVGMKALISPNTVEKAEYGSIEGSVVSVAEFPVTQESMKAILQNVELVKQFSHERVPIAVRIKLKKESTTVSGLKWSSSKGPPTTITPGTLVNAMITVREQAPIVLVIPALKKILGIT